MSQQLDERFGRPAIKVHDLSLFRERFKKLSSLTSHTLAATARN